ncbi:uncharacterized protein BJX67DRAFT_384747 [Aspergillus lucknowensis]|uniref:Uncharacterized protein n=1 Tax=Aspergillus lucknowensis TaxID=176173 RepID=A0ABR4LG32_9EURO
MDTTTPPATPRCISIPLPAGPAPSPGQIPTPALPIPTIVTPTTPPADDYEDEDQAKDELYPSSSSSSTSSSFSSSSLHWKIPRSITVPPFSRSRSRSQCQCQSQRQVPEQGVIPSIETENVSSLLGVSFLRPADPFSDSEVSSLDLGPAAMSFSRSATPSPRSSPSPRGSLSLSLDVCQGKEAPQLLSPTLGLDDNDDDVKNGDGDENKDKDGDGYQIDEEADVHNTNRRRERDPSEDGDPLISNIRERKDIEDALGMAREERDERIRAARVRAKRSGRLKVGWSRRSPWHR